MDEIRHSSPTGKRDSEGELIFPEGTNHVHTFISDGKEIGQAVIAYYSRPIKFFVIRGLNIDPNEQARGKGTTLLKSVQKFIVDKGGAGILESVPRAQSLYERAGWALQPQLPDIDGIWMGYNLPADISNATLWRMIKRTKVDDWDDRDDFHNTRLEPTS